MFKKRFQNLVHNPRRRLLYALKTFFGALSVSALGMGHPTLSTIILISGAFIDFLIDLFYPRDVMYSPDDVIRFLNEVGVPNAEELIKKTNEHE